MRWTLCSTTFVGVRSWIAIYHRDCTAPSRLPQASPPTPSASWWKGACWLSSRSEPRPSCPRGPWNCVIHAPFISVLQFPHLLGRNIWPFLAVGPQVFQCPRDRSYTGKRGCHGWEIIPNSKPSSLQRTWDCNVHCISAGTNWRIWPYSLRGQSLRLHHTPEGTLLVSCRPFHGEWTTWLRLQVAGGILAERGKFVPQTRSKQGKGMDKVPRNRNSSERYTLLY